MDKKWRQSIFQLLPLDGRYFLTVALKNTLIRWVFSVRFPENSYWNKYFVNARWPVKLSVQYDQSEREHAGSIDEHAGQEFTLVANTLVRFGLLSQLFTLGLRPYEIIHSSKNTKGKKRQQQQQKLTSPHKRLQTPQNLSTQRHERSERIAKEYMCARYRLLIGRQRSPIGY